MIAYRDGFTYDWFPNNGVLQLDAGAGSVPSVIVGSVEMESVANFLLQPVHSTSRWFIGRIVTSLNKSEPDHSVA